MKKNFAFVGKIPTKAKNDENTNSSSSDFKNLTN